MSSPNLPRRRKSLQLDAGAKASLDEIVDSFIWELISHVEALAYSERAREISDVHIHESREIVFRRRQRSRKKDALLGLGGIMLGGALTGWVQEVLHYMSLNSLDPLSLIIWTVIGAVGLVLFVTGFLSD